LLRGFILQSVALLSWEVALVAFLSEREVVVQALLASPITSSLDHRLFAVCYKLVVDCLCCLLLFLLTGWLQHVLWLALEVFWWLRLLASEALLSAFEVVVLALFTLPSTIWEIKAWLLARICIFSCFWRGFLEWLVDRSYLVLVARLLCLLVRSKVVDRNVIDSVIPLLVEVWCWLLNWWDVCLIWKHRVF